MKSDQTISSILDVDFTEVDDQTGKEIQTITEDQKKKSSGNGLFPFSMIPAKNNSVTVDEVQKAEEEATRKVDMSNEQTDYDTARDYNHRIMQAAMSGLERAEEIAAGTETSEHIESLAKMIKVTAEANEKLYEINKKRQEIRQAIGTGGQTNQRFHADSAMNVEQAVFIGSPADLLDQIKKKNEKDENA